MRDAEDVTPAWNMRTVRAVDHDGVSLAAEAKRLQRVADAVLVEVGAFRATAQDDEGVGVPACARDCCNAVFRDADEMVRRSRRLHGIHGDCEAAIGAVLESHGKGDARR